MTKKAENNIKFLRVEIDNVLVEVNELCADKDTKKAVYDELLSDIEDLSSRHAKITGEYIDNLSPDKIEDECRLINNDKQNLRRATRKLRQHCPDTSAVQNSRGSAAAQVMMPQLPLPTFHGDILKFPSFWDQFKCAVHDSDKLQPVQKFLYLRESLKGPALSAIDGYELTEANYPVVIEQIRDRFGKVRSIIFALVKDFISMSLVGTTTKELREFYDLLFSRVRSLEALKMDLNDKYVNMIIVPILEMKLKSDLLQEWEKTISEMDDNKITVRFFFAYVDKQICAREASERSTIYTAPDVYELGSEPVASSAALVGYHSNLRPTSRVGYQSNQMSSRPSAQPNPPQQPPSNRRTQNFIQCVFCGNNNHDVTQCQSLLNLPIDQRWDFVSQTKLCFNCLLPMNRNHSAASCRKSSCSVESCGKKHHRSLHFNEASTQGYVGLAEQPMERTHSLLQSGLAVLDSNGSTLLVRLLFDSGSERSYIRSSVAESMKLPQLGNSENLTITTLGGESTTRKYRNVKFDLVSRHDQNKRISMKAISIDRICAPLGPISPIIPQIDGPLADIYPRQISTVDVLVGQDYYYDIVHGNRCSRGPKGSAVAVDSIFGWILGGCISEERSIATNALSTSVNHNVITAVSNKDLLDSMTRFWDLENIGIDSRREREKTMSEEEQFAMDLFNNTVSFDSGRYTVKIPWKPNVQPPSDNYQIALRRLQSMEKQLLRKPERIEAYAAAIHQYETDGVSEIVTDNSGDFNGNLVNYFSHHAVYREDSATTKTRIVMNASLRNKDGVSLNDLILPGPALQPDMLGILIRFRMNRIGLVADVRKMFLQVNLDKNDQDSHRYLWRNMNTSEPPNIYRMTKVTFGVNCSPFLAIATVQHHARANQTNFKQASAEILQNMYVDDLASGSNTTENAIKLKNDLRNLMLSGGFELTKWASNSKEVMQDIPEEDRNSSLSDSTPESNLLKTLGLQWNLTTDVLSPDVNGIINGNDKETMRSTISLIAKIFDPLGWFGPFTISAKMLIQSLWSRQSKWDEILDTDCLEKWRKWKSQIPTINNFGVPRCVLSDSPAKLISLTLHGFSDASPQAYGCAVYTRTVYDDGTVNAALLMAKSRVAPLKQISLPRLELLGALICARLMTFIARSLGITSEDVRLWTDSSVTYFWLQKSPETLEQFVGNRVKLITSLFPPSTWGYCPGNQNPSDLLTRGISATAMVTSDLWWKGPFWICKPKAEWPKPPNESTQTYEEEKKVVASSLNHTLPPRIQSLVVTNPEKSEYEDVIIDPTHYSSWTRLLRVTAYVQVAAKKFKNVTVKNINAVHLTTEDIDQAENYWILKTQQKKFSDTFRRLENKLEKDKDNLLPLDPLIDTSTGILRVGGRLQKSQLSEESKHPIILPHHDWITRLVIFHVHNQACHVGPLNTLSLVRQKYWVILGRKEVQRILKDCKICAKYPSKARCQKMAPLPKERVTPEFAFSTVGIDFAGPLYLRCGTNRSRSVAKSYICLFTCAASRMIHLELSHDMSTPEFLQAFRRMTNRRGLCHTVYTDNALSFKASDRILRSRPAAEDEFRLNRAEVDAFFSEQRIKWKFITERSPWQGGFYERMIRSVKTSLRRVLGRALMTYAEMNTVLTDIEASINSRPLTVISTDVNDPEPLTPAHLAVGRPLKTLPDEATVDLKQPPEASRRYIYLKKSLEDFWKRWTLEYLPLLTTRSKWTLVKPCAKVGDVVLISDDNTPRGQWPLAIISQILPGNDGLVRNVQVRTGQGKILNRPVQRLYLLEEAAEKQQ